MSSVKKIPECKCPRCGTKAGHLNGDLKRKFFCTECCIEIRTDSNGNITKLFNITISGSVEEIKMKK